MSISSADYFGSQPRAGCLRTESDTIDLIETCDKSCVICKRDGPCVRYTCLLKDEIPEYWQTGWDQKCGGEFPAHANCYNKLVRQYRGRGLRTPCPYCRRPGVRKTVGPKWPGQFKAIETIDLTSDTESESEPDDTVRDPDYRPGDRVGGRDFL